MADNRALPLLGKTAVVTGASRGIGAGVALRLAQDGANVILGFTSEASSAKTVELQQKIESLPHKPMAHGMKANLADIEGPKQLVDAVLEWNRGATIDILINNAGLEVVKTLAELTMGDYDKLYNVNVRGTIFTTQAVLPYLPAKGRIINITSVGARAGFNAMSLYTSSKAAVEGLTRSWAVELGKNGTTVNAVAPGPVASDMLDKIPAEIKDLQKKTTPLENRFGTVEEIADIVAWLAGPSSGWITGQCINASGGWQMP